MENSKILKKVISKLKEVSDQIPGGRADNMPDSMFDTEQLQKGIEVEMEHTKDKDLAKEIAKDHLLEAPMYYLDENGKSRIDTLEEQANKEYKKEKSK